ncbi:TonB-dependent receptor [Sphingobium sp. MK2]|uniref:TonB-dependent receptor n=1 Tax=Sphingobium sp. MK2 TaxID=3116540 RepID=UPI0032E35F5A
MTNNAFVCRLLKGSAILAVATATPVTAQENTPADDPRIDDIIVTAQKRSENLQNVPIAVSVVSASTLASAGIGDVASLPMVTPSLTITTAGGGYVLPRIRGVGQAGVTLSLENPVAVYVDGVYYASAAGSLFSLNNIAQVAVLKGPQGTLFGRNATGGLIQVTTLDPSQDARVRIESTAGSQGLYGGSLYATGGLSENVAADLAMVYNNLSHGFGRNLFNGKRVNTAEDVAVRSKVKIAVGEDTTITAGGDYSLTNATRPAFRLADGTTAFNGSVPTGGKFDIRSDLQPYNRTEQAGANLTVEHDLGGATFSSITAYRWTTFETAIDNDGTAAPRAHVTAGQVERTFSQELQLSSDSSGPFVWTTGLYYFRLSGRFSPFVNINNNNGFPLLVINSSPKTKSYAAYAQATYSLTDKINLTGGLRWTKEERDIEGTRVVRIGPNTTATVPSAASLDTSKMTWRLALDYRPSDELLAYISYNRGFKSGGFNPTEIPYVPFQPEQIDAYEGGLKLDLFDRRLRVNPAIFYYDYKNLQSPVFSNGLLITKNAANAEIYGIDLDIQAALSSNLTLTGGLSWLHARYTRYDGAQLSTPLPAGGNALTLQDMTNKRLNNTPDWTANVGAEYVVPMGDNSLTFAANYSYNDGFFADAENRFRQKSFSVVNASAKLAIGDQYSLTMWGKNIGNTAYASQLVTTAFSDKLSLSPGRTIGITAGIEF